MSNNRPPAALDWLLVLVLALVWGASFLFIKRSVQIYTPIQMAMWRMVLATLVYLPIAFAFWKKIDWKRWKPLVIVAFCGSAIPNFCFAVAQQHVNSSLAGILNSLTPLFTMILGALFFQMKMTANKVLGVILGLSGAAMLILLNGQNSVGGNVFYTFLCVLATICYAVNANSVANYLKGQHPAAIASAAFILTGPLFFVGLFYTGGWTTAMQHPDGMKGLGYIFYLAALGTAGGSILYFHLLQRTSALFATSVTYLLPVMASVIGIFDGEMLTMMEIAGTIIILAGLYLARK
jgi:drug/metabolite transporter (DMT)-like permease